MSTKKTKILVMIDWYLPGFRAGGPIRSVANLVDGLGERFDFSIVTSDTDYGALEPYAGIEPDTWIERGPDCRVWYCSRDHRGYRHFRRIIMETDYDVLYLNSMFSLRYTIYPLWNSRSMKPEKPVVLAPRGMLHAGALAIKQRKKTWFLRGIKAIGAHKEIRFQATDAQEVADVHAVFGTQVDVVEAPNLPRWDLPAFQTRDKSPGQLRLIFLSRISVKKGVHLLLAALREQTAEIVLDLYGPDEEPGYWEQCREIISELPDHVRVKKCDPVRPEAIPQLVQAYHAFAMPTAGENFGHAIFEALAAGRPVILSDQHPWEGLEVAEAGYSVPLNDSVRYAAAISEMAAMDEGQFTRWMQGARQYAERYLHENEFVDRYLSLFRDFVVADPE
ncbi:MAG: glycosyltransferase family 4 protein [Bacteroidota bacterium]